MLATQAQSIGRRVALILLLAVFCACENTSDITLPDESRNDSPTRNETPQPEPTEPPDDEDSISPEPRPEEPAPPPTIKKAHIFCEGTTLQDRLIYLHTRLRSNDRSKSYTFEVLGDEDKELRRYRDPVLMDVDKDQFELLFTAQEGWRSGSRDQPRELYWAEANRVFDKGTADFVTEVPELSNAEKSTFGISLSQSLRRHLALDRKHFIAPVNVQGRWRYGLYRSGRPVQLKQTLPVDSRLFVEPQWDAKTQTLLFTFFDTDKGQRRLAYLSMESPDRLRWASARNAQQAFFWKGNHILWLESEDTKARLHLFSLERQKEVSVMALPFEIKSYVTPFKGSRGLIIPDWEVEALDDFEFRLTRGQFQYIELDARHSRWQVIKSVEFPEAVRRYVEGSFHRSKELPPLVRNLHSLTSDGDFLTVMRASGWQLFRQNGPAGIDRISQMACQNPSHLWEE